MPRKVRDASLDTRTARLKLKANAKPYFRLIEPGLHLGYRRPTRGERPGTWVVRRYDRNLGSYTVKNLKTDEDALVIADDYSAADGRTVLDFGQAQAAAKLDREHAATERAKPFTVRQALEAYLAAKEADARDIVDSRCRIDAHILPALGDIDCAKLTTEMLRDWQRALIKTAPRKRTKPGNPQQYRAFSGDKEAVRRRQASANRVMTILKAALNQAFERDKIASDAAWRKLKRFRGVNVARLRYLTIPEAKRLINACDPNFRNLVQAALQSGARYGQLTQLKVSDFHIDARGVGKLRLRSCKGDGTEKAYHATLTGEGTSLFKELCVGRSGDELIFVNNGRIRRAFQRERLRRQNLGESIENIVIDDAGEWRESEQSRPMIEACQRAGLVPPIGFHGLRHTWASLAVMNDVPLLVVANNLGHSDTRMVEKHYGHLAQSYVDDAIAAGAPKFGFSPSSTVVPLIG